MPIIRLTNPYRLDLADLSQRLFEERQAQQNAALNVALRECGMPLFVEQHVIEEKQGAALWENALRDRWQVFGQSDFASVSHSLAPLEWRSR